jgi:hypothetical protein
MNDDDVNILAAGGARYVAGPTETGGTVMCVCVGGGGQSHTLSKTFSFKRPLIALPPIF